MNQANENGMTSSGAKTYVDPETLFSITIPSGWMLDTSGQQGSKLLLYHPTISGSFRANVNVMVHDIGPLTHEEYIQFNRLQLKLLSGKSSLSVDEPYGPREAAHLFEWKVHRPEVGPVPLVIRQLIQISNKRAFVVTSTDALSSFDAHRKEFEEIMKSFTLKS